MREQWKLTSNSCSAHPTVDPGSVLRQLKKGQPLIMYKKVLTARPGWKSACILYEEE